MVGVGEEDLKQKEKAQLNYLLSVPKRAFPSLSFGNTLPGLESTVKVDWHRQKAYCGSWHRTTFRRAKC